MSKDNGTRIGWIGTGRMGAALARRLLEAGHDVAVYNRTRSKAEALGEPGRRSSTRRPTSPTATSCSRWSAAPTTSRRS